MSTKAEGHRKPDAPSAWPKRDRLSAPAHTVSPVRCLPGATHKLMQDARSACCLLPLHLDGQLSDPWLPSLPSSKAIGMSTNGFLSLKSILIRCNPAATAKDLND